MQSLSEGALQEPITGLAGDEESSYPVSHTYTHVSVHSCQCLPDPLLCSALLTMALEDRKSREFCCPGSVERKSRCGLAPCTSSSLFQLRLVCSVVQSGGGVKYYEGRGASLDQCLDIQKVHNGKDHSFPAVAKK